MTQSADHILICPVCRPGDLSESDATLTCGACKAVYPVSGGIPSMLRPDSAVVAREMDRMDFLDQG